MKILGRIKNPVDRAWLHDLFILSVLFTIQTMVLWAIGFDRFYLGH